MKTPFLFLRIIAVLILVLSFVSISAHSSTKYALETSEQDVILKISGSNTIGAKLIPAWAEHYLSYLDLNDVEQNRLGTENEIEVSGQKDGRRYHIHIAAHGSSTGFAHLLSGATDIAMSSRPIRNAEVSALSAAGNMRDYDSEHIVAIDGLAIIVHANNPVESLTLDDISSIFSGRIQNWEQVGGINRPINLYSRDSNSGTWDTFNNLVLRRQFSLPEGVRRFESNDELSDVVSNDIGGIGFVGLSSVRQAKSIAVSDGYTTPLKPEQLHVATEDYPLSRRLYLYHPSNANNKRARDFINFVQKSSSQNLVNDIGFVSLAPISTKPAELEGPEHYRAFAELGERLSINLRFNTGSAELDNRAKRDIERIVEYIQRPENKSKKIQLIGFGDLQENARRSVLLSKLRASAVQSALYKKGVFVLPVIGFGGYLPVAAVDGANSAKNQRVEVWVVDEEHEERLKNLLQHGESPSAARTSAWASQSTFR